MRVWVQSSVISNVHARVSVIGSWNKPLFVACFNTSDLLPRCLCLVDRALTESGNCSDVWNVWYSSAHNTPESRRGTRTLIRQNSWVSSFSVRSELIVLHSASALAQESATRIPKWRISARCACPVPGQRQELRSVSSKTRLYLIRKGSCDLATDEPMATCAVRGPARD